MPPSKYRLITLGIELGEKQRHLSAQEIATALNIGMRTVYRYIATLREDFAAPIVREWPEGTYACSRPWSMIEQLMMEL